MVLDGTLIPIDRVAADRPFYSGKHKRHGMNLQVIAAPAGTFSGCPGRCQDRYTTRRPSGSGATWPNWRPPGWSPWPIQGCQGSTHAKIPYRGKNKPNPRKTPTAPHTKLRSPGERANAQLKTWHILRKLRCCPWRAGQLAKAIHVLQVREA